MLLVPSPADSFRNVERTVSAGDSAALQRFSESVSFDWRLYRFDILGSIAHAKALERAGILTREELNQIENGLCQIEAEIAEEKFPFRIELEDLHMNIESALTDRIGEAGAKLHTARSRNDQVALDLRLYLRHESDLLGLRTRELQLALLELAKRNSSAVLPGYTHLQRAQPVLFAHHLLAYVEMLERDKERLQDARKRINRMPLGSGAMAGSTMNSTGLTSRSYSIFRRSRTTVWMRSATATSSRNSFLYSP